MMIDGYGGSFDRLNSRETVLDSLNELVELLEMKKLSEPVVYLAEDNGIKDPGGWSGFVVIMESHVSIHTFPGKGFISADVYTCRNGLDQKKISEFFQKKFELRDVEENFVIRGTRYGTIS